MPKSQAICDCYLACNAFQTRAWGKIGPILMLLFFLFIAFDAIRVLSFKMLRYLRRRSKPTMKLITKIVQNLIYRMSLVYCIDSNFV